MRVLIVDDVNEVYDVGMFLKGGTEGEKIMEGVKEENGCAPHAQIPLTPRLTVGDRQERATPPERGPSRTFAGRSKYLVLEIVGGAPAVKISAFHCLSQSQPFLAAAPTPADLSDAEANSVDTPKKYIQESNSD